jgi:hypothetical protein
MTKFIYSLMQIMTHCKVVELKILISVETSSVGLHFAHRTYLRVTFLRANSYHFPIQH